MSQQKLLKSVIQALDQNDIQYMITGSVASSLQGEPRSTHDIDLVVTINEIEAKKLMRAFPPPDYYIDGVSVLEAINSQRMFNLIDVTNGDKVDFWILTDEPFDKSRFSRRINVKFIDIEMKVSTPEDTILAKLKWTVLSGGSEKQFTDALRVYEVQYGKLDMEYLKVWVKTLNIELLWKKLTDNAEIVR